MNVNKIKMNVPNLSLFREYSEKSLRGMELRFPWGVAWHHHHKRTVVFVPIPLNWVFTWSREGYYRLMQGPRDRLRASIVAELSEDEARGFNLGYQDGVKNGEETGLRRMKIFEEMIPSS